MSKNFLYSFPPRIFATPAAGGLARALLSYHPVAGEEPVDAPEVVPQGLPVLGEAHLRLLPQRAEEPVGAPEVGLRLLAAQPHLVDRLYLPYRTHQPTLSIFIPFVIPFTEVRNRNPSLDNRDAICLALSVVPFKTTLSPTGRFLNICVTFLFLLICISILFAIFASTCLLIRSRCKYIVNYYIYQKNV